MHETDTFTSQGHWELISRWLESGGKGKPLPKHSMLFFPLNPQLKMKTTRDGVVGHVCAAQGLGEARVQPQRRPAAAGFSDWTGEMTACLGCSGANTFSGVGRCLEAPAVLPVSPRLLHVPSEGSLGLAEHGNSPGTPQADGVPGSWPCREEGKSRANVR